MLVQWAARPVAHPAFFAFALTVALAIGAARQDNLPRRSTAADAALTKTAIRLGVAGTVRDSVTGLPVAHAMVSLTPGNNIITKPFTLPDAHIETGADGRFELKVPTPGPYALYATAENYVLRDESPRFLSIHGWTSEDVLLTPMGEIEGRIIDRDSGEPVPGADVRASAVEFKSGQLTVARAGSSARTAADGEFRIVDLRPGRYFLEFSWGDAEEVAEVVPASDDEDGNAEPERLVYRHQWWPGVGTLGYSLALRLDAGFRLNLSTIAVSKDPVYEFRGTLKADACDPSDKYAVYVTRQFGPSFSSFKGPVIGCGGSFAVRNLAPGDYQLSARPPTGSTSASRIAWLNFTISDRSLRKEVWAIPPIEISGRLKLPDGFPAGLIAGLQLYVQPVLGVGLGEPRPTLAADCAIKFTLFSSRAVRLWLEGLPAPFYVAEWRYGGVPFADGVLEPASSRSDQNIEVEVSAKSGGLKGIVKEHGDPVPRAWVVAVPWPKRSIGGFPVAYTTTSGDDGRFRFEVLRPESYRVLAVPKETWDTVLQQSDALSALAADADATTVSPSQTADCGEIPLARPIGNE